MKPTSLACDGASLLRVTQGLYSFLICSVCICSLQRAETKKLGQVLTNLATLYINNTLNGVKQQKPLYLLTAAATEKQATVHALTFHRITYFLVKIVHRQ